MPDTRKVICVGTTPDLLKSRRLVLESAGYQTTCLGSIDAIKALLTNAYDVMLVSATVPEEDLNLLRKAVSEHTRIIQLRSFTSPQELLALVKH